MVVSPKHNMSQTQTRKLCDTLRTGLFSPQIRGNPLQRCCVTNASEWPNRESYKTSADGYLFSRVGDTMQVIIQSFRRLILHSGAD